MFIEILGSIILIIARLSGIILSATSCLVWALIIIGIQLIIITICSMLYKNKFKNYPCSVQNICHALLLSFINCIYNSNLKEESKIERIGFYCSNAISNFALIVSYYICSLHGQWIKLAITIYVAVCTLSGILILEKYVGTIIPTNDVEKGKVDKSDSKDFKETVTENKLNNINQCDGNIKETHLPPCDQNLSTSNEKSILIEDEPQVLNKQTEVMLSIKDLLANTSVVYNYDKESLQDGTQINNSKNNCSEEEKLTNSSFHEVGVPVKDEKTHISLTASSHNNFTKEPGKKEKCFPKILGNSSLDQISFSSNSQTEIDLNRSIEIARNLFNSDSNDYENIYDAIAVEEPIPQAMSNTLKAKVMNGNESLNTFASSHDYENILPANVYRATTGVRHWKTYFDIEDKIHDFSTFKERSLIQDSTINSHMYSNMYFLKDSSCDTKGVSSLSISLPDLSNIKTNACLDGEFSEEHSYKENNTQCTNVTPNYETIWYSDDVDCTKGETYDLKNNNGATSIIATIDTLRNKESLCNLYYSSLSDLSSKYFDPGANRLRVTNSISNLQSENYTNGKSPSCFNANKISVNELVTPIKCIKGGVNLKRTQKSPLFKLLSRSQSTLQERTTRVLQVGKRVFYKQRVHVITPKKELHSNFVPRIRSPEQLKVDPYIFKRRINLSPKDRLILSEASMLMKMRQRSLSDAPKKSSISSVHPQERITSEPPVKSSSNETNAAQDGPQHSTPENDKHVPQISILSTISSVASPENGTLFSDKFKSTASLGKSLSSGNVNFLLKSGRCSARQLKEMSSIEELDSIPSQV